MKLYESEAKTIIQKYGIPIPHGEVVSSPDEARDVALDLRLPVVIKAQVLVAGRGKAGGILAANSIEDVTRMTEELLSRQIKGMPVNNVLIEEKIQVKRELYFGLTVDRFNRSYVVIASTTGGMEIEEAALSSPEEVIKIPLNPDLGLSASQAREIAMRMGYADRQLSELQRVFEQLHKAGMDYDAELIETNPLVETVDGKFVAVDARIILDDNSLFRHQEYEDKLWSRESDLSPGELEAKKNDLSYVKLHGNIGVIGNGAGLVMATLDTIQYYGGEPANFLDIGGGASSEKTASALELVLLDPDVVCLFINILGGITQCDEVARGILEMRKKFGIMKQMVIRLMGTNEEEGRRILTRKGIQVFESMEKAAKRVVEIARQEAIEFGNHNQ